MEQQWELLQEKSNIIKFSGYATFSNILCIRKKGEELIDSLDTSICIDLSSLTKIDSSCLSLFIRWLGYAKTKNKTLEFINVSQEIKNLTRVCGLDEVLPINLKQVL